eukprot:CAMPEP_0178913378 /NCGR_PEP_ID=MMETSP0786-20121207/10806_1 /TAXON_ID=186022 /ORGANISM="Thalassionema frauenfeldii, Strain CCMP 1798" /LENGTH=210 /DNA_ID=CAMNT_0020586107 /DNA_START=986 /DNA_END=1619 /DNA_ORIENTATION=+
MTSFELKPNMWGHYHNIKSAHDMSWSQQRDHMPPQLTQQGVPLSLWQATYDKVLNVTQNDIDLMMDFKKDFNKIMFFPCLMFCCCPLGRLKLKIEAHNKERIQNWDDLVLSESKKYREYGIQVSFAKEFITRGVGSQRHLSTEIVGLLFQIVLVAPSRTSQATMTFKDNNAADDNGTITERLKKFEQLYKDGLITKDEYNAGRDKVLQSI